MPKLEVTARELRYNKVTYKTGDTFEASEKDAKVLKAVKRAKDAPAEAPKPARKPSSFETRVLTPETATPATEPTVRRYRRSDMRPED